MSHFDFFLDKQVLLELSGKIKFSGILIDYGLDILVLYNGQQYIYIPLMQVQNIRLNLQQDVNIIKPADSPIDQQEKISLRKMISNSKGLYIKIFVKAALPKEADYLGNGEGGIRTRGVTY